MARTAPKSEVRQVPERAWRRERVDVGRKERWLSTLGGSVLVAYGLARRSVPALALAVAGGALIKHGVAGRDSLARSSRRGAARRRQRLFARQAQDQTGRRTSVLGPTATRIERSVTIARPREEIYAFWHNFANLPRFMEQPAEVEVIDERHSRWTAGGPAGKRVSWKVEVVDDLDNELISWRSMEPSDLDTAGEVRFIPAPGDRGTEVRVAIEHRLPAGALWRALAGVFGDDPDQQLKRDLRRLKQRMEAGEIPTTEGQPAGRHAGREG